jgi:predicted phage baseplate assembly protein
VNNPLGASGGADADTRDQARRNVPLAVQALDRVVSVSDYADVARASAGIGKAVSSRLSTPAGEIVHVTVAGAADVPVLPSSDLFGALETGLADVGDPGVAARLGVRELVFLVIAAGVGLEPDYAWEEVEPRIRAALEAGFGFEARDLGRPVAASEVIAAIQAVPGVAFVDLDTFGGIPEQVVDPGPPPAARLITQPEIAARIEALAAAPPARWVRAECARFEGGILRPAQLALLSPGVPDTLILTLR